MYVIQLFSVLGFAQDLVDPIDCPKDCTGETNGSFWPHPKECTLYYECEDDVTYLRKCVDDFEFNPTIRSCDHPETAGCIADADYVCPITTTIEPSTTEETTPPTDPPTSPPTDPSTDPSTIPSTEPTGPPTTLTTSEGPCLPPCPDANVDFAHPQDCTKFIECANYIAYEFDCPAGLEYWAEGCQCDTPEIAGCTLDETSPCVANPPFCDESP